MDEFNFSSDGTERPTRAEVVQALEYLVDKRREYLAAIEAHEAEIDKFSGAVAEIDMMLASMRDDDPVSGLFEAADVADRAMGEWR